MNIVEAIKKAGPNGHLLHPGLFNGKRYWTGSAFDKEHCIPELPSILTEFLLSDSWETFTPLKGEVIRVIEAFIMGYGIDKDFIRSVLERVKSEL